MTKILTILTLLCACRTIKDSSGSNNTDSTIGTDTALGTDTASAINSDSDMLNAGHILPLGDSITKGIPYTYRYPLYQKLTQLNISFDFVGSHQNGGEAYPDAGWDKHNEGWSGWTTENIAQELPTWLSEYAVDMVLIHLGTNDALSNDIDGSLTAMTSIVNQLRVNNALVSICIAQILPFRTPPENDGESVGNELNIFVDSWNAQLAALASDMTTPDSPITVVDMNSTFSNADLNDGSHPNRAGAEKMADQWVGCITGQ